MKEKKDCKIIQDLLPNYIENLTNEETNKFIDEHLKKCNECKNVLENMKKELKINTTKRDDREVNYIKKYSKKMKFLRAIIVILIIAYLIVIARRFIIITRLANISKEYIDKTNYIEVVSYVKKDMMYMIKTYNKDGDFSSKMEFYGPTLDDKYIVTSYKKGNDKIKIIQRGENIEVDELTSSEKMPINSIYKWFGDKILENLKAAIKSRITINDYHGKECYLIEKDLLTLWVDKDTGIVYRQINGGFGLAEITYEFDVVKDENITRPDI